MHILKFKAAFVLRIEHPDQPIPYAKAVRLQVGAANGLRRLLGIPSQGVPDIQQVLNACIGRYGEFEQIPYEQLFDSIRSTSRRGD
ncbi:MAG: hypothetical protein OEZ43_09615 [Gammaproteobacteria bacterium]|nr:hypothetical protein [Gammaproteobacteria bacterium]